MLFKSIKDKINSLNVKNVITMCNNYTRDTDLYKELVVACSYPEEAITSNTLPLYMQRNIELLLPICYNNVELFYDILIFCKMSSMPLNEHASDAIKDILQTKDGNFTIIIKELQQLYSDKF